MNYRIEKDTMGEVQVPADKYWGAQTERSRNNFKIGPEASMPIEIIHAFGYLKKAAAMANFELGVLAKEKKELIANACDEVIAVVTGIVTVSDNRLSSRVETRGVRRRREK